MSLYAEPIEWKGSLVETAKIACCVVDVLGRYNFKGKEGIKCSLTGIESIVTKDGRVIKPDIGGFLDEEISTLLGLMADGAKVNLNHPNKWYAMHGNYIRPSEVLHKPDIFTATINVSGHIVDRRVSNLFMFWDYGSTSISVGIRYEIGYNEDRFIPELKTEIALVFERLRDIKI